MRVVIRALVLLAFAGLAASRAGAVSFTATPGGDDVVRGISPEKRTAYATFTGTGTAVLPAASCAKVRVRVLPSIDATATGAVSVTAYDCALGTSALDTAGKRRCTQACSSFGCALDGSAASGTDAFWDLEPTVLGVEVVTHPGGGQKVAIEARCR